jgi:hypothetical protein
VSKSKRISKRVREEAADYVQAMACSEASTHADEKAIEEQFSPEAVCLGDEAFFQSPMRDESGEIPWHEQWAEAESWLRTGWSPT